MPGFRAFDDSRLANIELGDTLETIAARERAAGNPITAEDIAAFNWGATDPAQVQELMRDELGARARVSETEFALSPDDTARNPLRIPEPYAQTGFAMERTHTLRVRRRTCPPQFVGCCALSSLTFGFNSSFVRPEVVESLGAVEALIAKDPATLLFVFGHTDPVGDAAYNKRLSERRAWAVYSFILNDAEAWETLYNHPDEDWGVAVLQEILADLGHDPGAIDGEMGPNTRSAMRAFLGLPEDASVKNDATFRKQLFAAYMGGKHDIEIGADRFLGHGHMGCGEYNLLQDGEVANERNRRVVIYAFHRERPPNLPCAYDDSRPCERHFVDRDKRYTPGFACSFYDSLAGACPGEGRRHQRVYLLDRAGYAIPNCPFRALDGDTVIMEGTTDGGGVVVLPDSAPDIVRFEWAHAPGAAEGFLFCHAYRVRAPAPATENGVAVRLKNLGFMNEALEEADRCFEAFFGLARAARPSEWASAIEKWHGTGDPTHILSSSQGAGEEPGEDPPDGDPDDYPEGWFDDCEG